MRVGAIFSLALASLVSAAPITRRSDSAPAYDYCQAPTLTDYQPIKDHELLKVVLYTRHGDRTPAYILPHDKQVWNVCNDDFDTTVYDNNSNIANLTQRVAVQERINIPSGKDSYDYVLPKGNCVVGQLTDKGKEQHVELGDSLRNVYVDRLNFLPEKLDSSQMYVRSTDVWRTRQSAHSLLTGLYPNGSRADAVDVITRPSEVENISRNPTACPAFTKFEKEAREEPEWKKVWNENKPAMDRMNQILGTTDIPEYSKRWGVLHDVLWTRICHGFPLPCSPTNSTECITQADADLALKMAHFEYVWLKRDSAVHHNVDMGDLGSMMKELKQELEIPTVPFTFYSSHDDTLATFLGMFQAEDMKWPPYASHLIFEVWQNTKNLPEKVVRVLFNGKPIITGNGEPCKDLSQCPLDKFTKFMDTYIPENLKEFCEYKN